MRTDWSVELAAEDPALEIPWADPEGPARYFDLRYRPELLLEIPEAAGNNDLAELLATINSAATVFASAKCDTWLTDEITEEEQLFGAAWKYACYVDLMFVDAEPRASFPHNEALAQTAAVLLGKAPEIPASAEFVLRRCFTHAPAAPEGSLSGFCITCYISGFGDDQDQARRRWNIAVRLVQNALIQLSARMLD